MRWFLILSVAVQLVYSKRFEKCELADVLENKHNMPRDEVKNWVCIAEYESTFNTEAVNRFKNWDGSKDYGLFQLNNKYWCKDEDENPAFQNVCQMPCSKLLDADLTDDLACIRKIIRGTEAWKGKGTGLTAWVAYVNKCQNRNLDEYMSECWTGDNVIGIRGDGEEEEEEENTINVRDEEEQEVSIAHIRVPIVGPLGPAIVDNARVPVGPLTQYFQYFQPQQPFFFLQQRLAPAAAAPPVQHIIYQPQLQYQQLYRRM